MTRKQNQNMSAKEGKKQWIKYQRRHEWWCQPSPIGIQRDCEKNMVGQNVMQTQVCI